MFSEQMTPSPCEVNVALVVAFDGPMVNVECESIHFSSSNLVGQNTCASTEWSCKILRTYRVLRASGMG